MTVNPADLRPGHRVILETGHTARLTVVHLVGLVVFAETGCGQSLFFNGPVNVVAPGRPGNAVVFRR